MKDKRILLRVGSIIEIIYTFVMMVYYILKGRLTDEVIANLFILIIGFIVGVLLFKISLKSIDEIKDKARSKGLKTLNESCRELVLSGITTMEQLIKITYSVDI